MREYLFVYFPCVVVCWCCYCSCHIGCAPGRIGCCGFALVQVCSLPACVLACQRCLALCFSPPLRAPPCRTFVVAGRWLLAVGVLPRSNCADGRMRFDVAPQVRFETTQVDDLMMMARCAYIRRSRRQLRLRGPREGRLLPMFMRNVKLNWCFMCVVRFIVVVVIYVPLPAADDVVGVGVAMFCCCFCVANVVCY